MPLGTCAAYRQRRSGYGVDDVSGRELTFALKLPFYRLRCRRQPSTLAALLMALYVASTSRSPERPQWMLLRARSSPLVSAEMVLSFSFMAVAGRCSLCAWGVSVDAKAAPGNRCHYGSELRHGRSETLPSPPLPEGVVAVKSEMPEEIAAQSQQSPRVVRG
jgi:hypothetical protein